MVALVIAGLTPQSLTRQLPFQGRLGGLLRSFLQLQLHFVSNARLRRSLALPSLKGKVARERRKGFPRIQKGVFRRSMCWLGTRNVAFIATGLTPQLLTRQLLFQGRLGVLPIGNHSCRLIQCHPYTSAA